MINLDSILRNHKAQKMSHINAKNTFVWIESYVIMTTSQKNVSKMPRVVLPLLGMSWEIIKVRLHDVLNIVKCIGHGKLECISYVLEAKR